MKPIHVSIARRMISSKYYNQNRMAQMDRECAFYIEQVKKARTGVLRNAFAKMVWIYYKRYTYYLKKCTEDEHRKSIQAGA